MDTEKIRMGKEAFNAYNSDRGGVNYRGEKTPEWEELPPGIRQAWHVAADAVCKESPLHVWLEFGPGLGKEDLESVYDAEKILEEDLGILFDTGYAIHEQIRDWSFSGLSGPARICANVGGTIRKGEFGPSVDGKDRCKNMERATIGDAYTEHSMRVLLSLALEGLELRRESYMGDARCTSIAITKLEEASMWFARSVREEGANAELEENAKEKLEEEDTAAVRLP